MLLRQFKRTGPLTVFLISLILVLLWAGAFIRVKDQFTLYFDIDPMPLYGLISSALGTHPVPGITLSLFLVAGMAILVVNLNTILFFINERTFLPALFYVLLTGIFPQYQLLNPAAFGAVFLMVAIRRIMESYRVQGTAYSLFDAGILISTGSLFYANLIWFGLIIFTGMSLLRTWNARELIVALLGLATPYVLTPGIYYVFGGDPSEIFRILEYNIFGKQSDAAFTPLVISGIILTGILSGIAISHLTVTLGTKKIQSRKTFLLLLWVFLISVAAFILVPSVSAEMIWIAGIPVCYFLSHYFVFQKRRLLPEIAFSLFFFVIVLIQVWHLR